MGDPSIRGMLSFRIATMNIPRMHDTGMPIVSVRMYPGRGDDLKMSMSEAVADAVSSTLGIPREAVTVAVEEILPEDYDDAMGSLEGDVFIREGLRVR